MKKFVQGYRKIEEIVCGVTTVLGLSIILYNVFCRYVLRNPHPETDEICMVVMSVAIILGFSINVGEDNNIDMDLVYTKLKNPVIIAFFDIFRKVCMCIYSLFILYYGYQAVAMQYTTGRSFPLTQIPFWISYSIIVYVGFTMTVATFTQLILYIRGLTKKARK